MPLRTGRAPRTKLRRPRSQNVVIPDIPVWQQLRRIGGGLTPERVSSIIRMADVGEMADLMDLANEARQKDLHLQSILETRENAVLPLAWDLELPPQPSRKEKKAAALVRDVLTRTLPAIVPHHNGSVFYGYAVSEQVWAKVDNQLVPSEIRPVAPRRFRYEGSSLHFYDRAGALPKPGVDLRDFPGQFIVSRPRVNGDVPCREGLVRPLMWAALFRNWTIGDWMKLAEIAWKPWRTGTYKKGSSQDDIDSLYGILNEMTSNGVAVYPDSTQVNVMWPTASGNQTAGTHGALFSVLASEMSKGVLGQTETTESSKSSGYAQAKVHNEVKKEKRNGDAAFIAADVTRDSVEWITWLNYGPDVRPSRLFFKTEDGVDVTAFSGAVKTFVDAGLRMPAKWARAMAGIPDPVDGEEIIGGKPEGDEDESDDDAPGTPVPEDVDEEGASS